MEGPTGHNAPLDTWPEPCRAKVGVGRRPTTRAEKDCSLGAGHAGEETPPGGCTAPPKLPRFTACSPEGYPTHCAALRLSLLGPGEADWERSGAGRGQPSALPDGKCSSEKRSQGGKAVRTTFPGEGVATAGREVQRQSREQKERPGRHRWFCSFAPNPCGATSCLCPDSPVRGSRVSLPLRLAGGVCQPSRK